MNTITRTMAILAALTLLNASAFADPVRIVDGDTIKIDGTTYRLWGIDAAETRQLCADGWAAGVEATTALTKLMLDKRIDCEPRTKDRYGRTVALCRADGQDLGEEMVRTGNAWAFVRYSRDYTAAETEARAARAGVHAHDCKPAWDWRAGQRAPAIPQKSPLPIFED